MPPTHSRVLPGAKTNAGGNGPGLRYRQPQNLSYHSLRLPPYFFVNTGYVECFGSISLVTGAGNLMVTS